jgi:hypothetical protein
MGIIKPINSNPKIPTVVQDTLVILRPNGVVLMPEADDYEDIAVGAMHQTLIDRIFEEFELDEDDDPGSDDLEESEDEDDSEESEDEDDDSGDDADTESN